HEHYALWEVIEFGYSYVVPTNDTAIVSASEGTATKKGRTVALTTEDMQKRRNDVKAITTLLLALPDEQQLRFSKYKTAQELWAAILKTFGGKETLEQTFNRLQAIVSQLEFMDVEIKQDDLNQKLLTSLSPEWLMHTIVWRNRSDLDTMSLDDLYNHLKVYELEVQKKSDYQNMAFISSSKNSSRNKKDNTAEKNISIQGTDVTGFDKLKVECFNCHKMDHFSRECRAPRSQDRGRRDHYRQGSKVEEQALKALMAIDRVGWDWSFMANEVEDHALVADEEAPTEFALMAKTNAKSEVFDNSLCSKNCKKNTESLNSKITDLTEKLCDRKNMMFHYKAESNPNDLQNSSSSASNNGESTVGVLSKPEIKFVRPADTPIVVKTDKVETAKKRTVKYAEQYRKPSKTSNVRGNQRNWNNLNSQQLGVKKGRTCPTNTHKSISPRPAVHKTHKPQMRPIKPNVNAAQPKRTSFYKPAHSYNKRKVPTGNIKFSTADMGNKGKAIKASACWIWKPTQNLSNKGPNRNCVSVMFKKATPRIILMTKAIGTVVDLDT
nr:hypothetical protein [Tanacetum cinerariifolium]